MKNALLIVLLAGLAMMGAFSIDTYLPSFPSVAEDFRVGMDAVQQTLTVFLLAMAVMTLFHGTLSDVLGRRPVILANLGIYTAASLGAAVAPNLGVLLLCRFFQGFSAGAGMVVGRAMIRDCFSGPEAQRVMSYTTVVFGLAPVIAPIVGGWLEVVWGWHSVFLFLTGYGVIMVIACWIALPESLPVAERSPLHLGSMVRDYLTVARNPKFMLRSLAIALSCTGVFLYVSSAPAFVIHILHLPPTAFAWLFIPLIFGIMSGSAMAGRVAHSWRPRRILSLGFGLMMAAAVFNVGYNIFCTPGVPWAVLPLLVYNFGMSFIGPVMTIQTLDLFPARRGLAASFQAAFTMAVFAALSGLVAPLLFGSGLHLALGVLTGGAISAVLWWATARLPDPAAT